MKLKSITAGMYEFRNAYLHLVADESNRLLYSEWLRPPTSQEYRAATTIFAKCLREKGLTYWLQDTNHLGDVPVEALKWALQELVPVAASSGLKKLARITADNSNLTLFMSTAYQMQVKLNAAIEVQQFKTYREAVAWLTGDLF